MGNLWIRFGCFLTGYNYTILRNSSEAASKAVKRYTAAMLIIGILWSFIGYTFTDRYLHGGVWGSLAGAAVLLVIIVQIERQIILSINPGIALYVFRGMIAMMMAVIGAVIIDQVIFADDINLAKMTTIQKRVDEVLPAKTDLVKKQIAEYDSLISVKEGEKKKMLVDISQKPTVPSVTTQSVPTVEKESISDSGRVTTREKVVTKSLVTVNKVPNPYIAQLPAVDTAISQLTYQKTLLGNKLIDIRPQIEDEIKANVGFLDELEVMYQLIINSRVAMFVWLLWFFFLVGLEMLVLISKINDRKNDYDETVIHQMNHQLNKLKLLSKMAERN